MPTHRDQVRAARSEAYRAAAEVGINMEAERAKIGSNQRTLAYDAVKLLNDPTPRVTRDQQQVDDPPTGAFNGFNTLFDLSAPVIGENITVIWHDATGGAQWVLTKGNANPPATHEFFFDSDNPTVIVVGNPPGVSDGLVAVFRVQRG